MIASVHLTLHRQNKTGRNTAIAIVMGMNQLSSDAYGSLTFGPDVRLNLTSWSSSSSAESSFSESMSCGSCSCTGGMAGSSGVWVCGGTNMYDIVYVLKKTFFIVREQPIQNLKTMYQFDTYNILATCLCQRLIIIIIQRHVCQCLPCGSSGPFKTTMALHFGLSALP